MKKVNDPLTMVISARVDIRTYATLIYDKIMRGEIVRDNSSTIRGLIKDYAEIVVKKDEQSIQLLNDTYYAKGFLIKQGLYNPSGQDRSVNYAQSHQYEKEEFLELKAVKDGVSLKGNKEINDRARELEEMLLEEQKRLTSTNTGMSGKCVNCNKSYNPNSLTEEQRKIWEEAGKQVCPDCIDKYFRKEESGEEKEDEK